MLGSVKALPGGNVRTGASMTVRIHLVSIKPTATNHEKATMRWRAYRDPIGHVKIHGAGLPEEAYNHRSIPPRGSDSCEPGCFVL